jgi:hypothetical protein
MKQHVSSLEWHLIFTLASIALLVIASLTTPLQRRAAR